MGGGVKPRHYLRWIGYASAERSVTCSQPWTRLLRQTSLCMAKGVGGCQGVSTEFELKFFCADLSRMPAPIDPGTAHPPGLVTPVTQTTATTMSDDDMNVDEGASNLSGGLRGLSLFPQSQAGGL